MEQVFVKLVNQPAGKKKSLKDLLDEMTDETQENKDSESASDDNNKSEEV